VLYFCLKALVSYALRLLYHAKDATMIVTVHEWKTELASALHAVAMCYVHEFKCHLSFALLLRVRIIVKFTF